MKKLRGAHILERGERFLSCWKELTPEGTEFSGMTREELMDDVAACKAIRERVRSVEIWLRSLRFERDQTDRKLAKKLMRMASGVRGDPAFGEDCAFYRALGFVPISENRSGRPRKQKTGKSRKKPA